MFQPRFAKLIQPTATFAAIVLATSIFAAPIPTPQTEPAPQTGSAPVDLKPRPLGLPSQPTTPPADGRAAEGSGSAAAAMWSNPFVRTTASLAIVLSLILVLAAVAKRSAAKNGGLAQALGYTGARPAGIIEILGRYPIGRGQTLILLKLDRRVLLLGQTAGRLRGSTGSLATLCQIDDVESVASILTKVAEHDGSSTSAKFNSLLSRFDRSHAEPDADAFEATDLRRVSHSAEGDRSELWDDQAVVHKFPAIQPAQDEAPAPQPIEHIASTGTYAPAGHAHVSPQGDSYSAIRQRLHALKGEAHR